MKNKCAVIFDLDGTLLDTLEDLTDALNYLLDTLGYPNKSLDEVRALVGNGARDLVARALPIECTEEELVGHIKAYATYYRAHAANKTHAYDGIEELLSRLFDAKIPIAVVSNKPDEAVRDLCRKYFGSYVKCAVGDAAGRAKKPAPDSVIYAMKECGCERAIFVGDSDTDVMTANNAGIPVISVTWGFRDRDFLSANGATLFADSAEELSDKIFELLGNN